MSRLEWESISKLVHCHQYRTVQYCITVSLIDKGSAGIIGGKVTSDQLLLSCQHPCPREERREEGVSSLGSGN